jgi:hypothetical protein
MLLIILTVYLQLMSVIIFCGEESVLIATDNMDIRTSRPALYRTTARHS